MNTTRKLVSAVLCFILLLSLFPSNAFAEEKGQNNDEILWEEMWEMYWEEHPEEWDALETPDTESRGATRGADTSLSAMRSRAEAIVNYQWVPSSNITTWNKNPYNGNTVFYSGTAVTGMPYTLFTSEVVSQSLCSLSEYKTVAASNYSATAYCKSVSATRTGPVYGSCCADLVSEVFGGNFMSGNTPRYHSVGSIWNTSYGTTIHSQKMSDIRAGDAVSDYPNHYHIIWVGEVTDTTITIYEQTPPIARKLTLNKAAYTNSSGYFVYGNYTYSTITRSKEFYENGGTTSSSSSNEEVIYNYLTGTLGFNQAAACAILGNMRVETGTADLSPTAHNANEGAWGLCQWEGSRLTSLQSQYPSSWKTLSSQLAFLKWELEGGDYSGKSTTKYLKALPNTQDGASDGARYFAKYFERCASSTYSNRMNHAANTYWPRYGATPPDVPIVSTANSQYAVGDTVMISWNTVANNRFYWINVYKDESLIVDQSMGSTTSYSLTNAGVGSYTIYVSANNTAGTSGVSSCTFTVAEPYANLGDDFYAVILNTALWKPISQKESSNRITLETETGIAMQKWHFVRQSDGAYAITSCYNGNALEMTDGIRTAGMQITAHDSYWNGAYQQWYLIPQGNGYIFQSKHYKDENWVMDLDGASGADGSAIQIYPRNNGNAQIWSVYAGNEVQISKTVVSSSVTAPNVTFIWENRYGVKDYRLIVWKGDPSNGNKVYDNANAKSGETVALAAGTYYAAVETSDFYQTFMSDKVQIDVPTVNYTVHFDAMGGSSESTEKQVVFGAAYGSLPVPTRENNTFDGWYTSPDGSSRITETTTVSATLDHTLYAHWTHICAAGHAYTYRMIAEPTLTAEGLLEATCSRCGETTGIILPVLSEADYTYTVSKPASCTATGIGNYAWKNEAYGQYSFSITIPKTEHPYQNVVSAPACTEQGYTTHTCVVCGDSYQDSVVDALGHAWDEGNVTIEPTQNQSGTKLYVCERCGETKTESIPALSHVHNYVASAVQPTCTEQGYTLYKCSCGASYQENYVDARGHNFRYVLQTAPTETTAGKVSGICTRCSYTETIIVPKLNSQDYDCEETNQATCTATGSMKYTWKESAYGTYAFNAVIPKVPHRYESSVTDATCTAKGYTTHTCTVCGYTFRDGYTEAANHSFANCTVTHIPTIQSTGEIRAVCETCGFAMIVNLPKLNSWGYAYERIVTPTCTAEGVDRYTWNTTIYGEHSFDAVVDRTGHSYTGVVVEPSCTEAGYTTYLCSVCGNKIVEEETDALGHDYGEWEAEKPVTCTIDGIEVRKCSRCGESQLRDVAATGHSFENGICSSCGLADPYNADAQLVVDVQSFSASPGATIQIPVMISGDVGFAGFTLSIISSNGLTLTDIAKGSLLASADGSFMKNVALGNVNWTSSEDINGNGELLVLTYVVEETAEEGTQFSVTIRLKDNKALNMVNAQGTPVTVRFESIFVDVLSQLFGDVDGDGDITTADAVKLVRFLVDLEDLTEQQKLAADVSHDNDITSADSIKLVRYLVGLEESLEPSRMARRADTATAAIVAAEYISGKKGETVTVPVTIIDNPGFAGFTIEVEYPEAVELIKITAAPMLKNADGGSFICNLEKRLINWTNTGDITEDGELFYLTFRLLEDVDEAAEIELRAKDDKGSNFVDEAGRSIILNRFKDMPEKDTWSYDAINWALANKITSGTTVSAFSPDAACSRAQVVTFLWRAAGEPEPTTTECAFSDVSKDEYYYKAVLWASESGITSGISASAFSPNTICTRAQIVTFLWRNAGSPEARAAGVAFTDLTPDPFYEKAVRWAYEAGITAGTSATAFSPNATCTRAQIVTFLYRDAIPPHRS